MNHARSKSRHGRILSQTLALLAVGAGGLVLFGSGWLSPASAADANRQSAFAPTPQVAAWSDRIWKAAKDGNVTVIEESLKEIPDSNAVGEVERLRQLVDERSRHVEATQTDRTEDRAEARKELAENLEKGDISKALTSAVKLQTLSDDWKAPLDEADMQRVIAQAIETDAKAEREGDWLLAQEVLFRLRTLYEDSGEAATFKRYDESLEKVNRRIGLLAQYAPKKLHDLRRVQAERLGTAEKFPEWNPAFADDWREQLSGVSQPMLAKALKQAANEHISAGGWQPLLSGGIDSLAVFATTDSLGETFPGLNDPAEVKEFLAALDRGRATLEHTPPSQLGRTDYNTIFGDILKTNAKSLQIPDSVICHEFGDGAIDELAKRFDDQYSEIIWPERLRRFQQQVDGNFVGVGILIRHDDKREIVVVNPLEGSPAARGGVKADDRIASVDGVSTVGWSLNKAVDAITGPAGQTVTLGINRAGSEEETKIPLRRDTIKIRSVNGWWKEGLDPHGNPIWDWWIDRPAGIGYVRLTSFNEDSFADFRAAIDQMRTERTLNGLILDLRHNPGGLLKSAVDFTNIFLPGGEVVSGEDRNGRTVWRLDAQADRADLKDLPVVVLVNQGSASASEIVSGALQAHDSVVVVGERTFGKGSVQTVHDCSDRDGEAAVKLTTQYYILPPTCDQTHGRLVHKKPGADDWGVNPDVVVKMTPEQIEKSLELRQQADIIEEWKDEADRKERPAPNDLLAKNLDPQLEMALLILQARALKDLDAEAIAAAAAARK